MLSQRVYLFPLTLSLMGYYLPIFCWFIVHRPMTHDWISTTWYVHIVVMTSLLISISHTLMSPISRVVFLSRHRSILGMLLHVVTFGAILGQSIWIGLSFSLWTEEEEEDRDTMSFFFLSSVTHVCFWILCTCGCGCGSKPYSDPHLILHQGARRLRWLYRLGACSNSHKSGADPVIHELMETLVPIFSLRAHRDSDEPRELLTVSDILFGLSLVKKLQREERETIESDVKSPFLSSAQEQEEHDPDFDLTELDAYSKLAIGVYGWPLYCYYNPTKCCKVSRCWPSSPSSHTRAFSEYLPPHYRLVYFQPQSDLFQTPFGICYKVEKEEAGPAEIVLVLRGSLDVHDLLMDLWAQSETMEPRETSSPVPVVTHKGMLVLARAIFHTLADSENDVYRHLWHVLAHASAKVRLTVVGHSLGAGVSVLLTLMLHQVFGARHDIRGRAFGSPPVVQAQVSLWSRSFVQSFVYGEDWITRLSLSNVVRLRREVQSACERLASVRLIEVYCSGVRGLKKKLTPIQCETTDEREEDRDNAFQDFVSPMENPDDSYHRVDMEFSQASSAGTSGPELVLAGRIFHITKVRFSAKDDKREDGLECQEADLSDFQRILVTNRSLLDHFPHHYMKMESIRVVKKKNYDF